jgi:hypothetical protein
MTLSKVGKPPAHGASFGRAWKAWVNKAGYLHGGRRIVAVPNVAGHSPSIPGFSLVNRYADSSCQRIEL